MKQHQSVGEQRQWNATLPAWTDGRFPHGADRQRVQRGRSAHRADSMYADIAATFHALGDTTRIKIMLSLFDQELATSDLSAIISASESLVSQHLRVLRQGRLVKHERRGKRVEDTLDDAHIRTLLTVCLHHLGEDAVQQTAVSLAPNAMVRAKT